MDENNKAWRKHLCKTFWGRSVCPSVYLPKRVIYVSFEANISAGWLISDFSWSYSFKIVLNMLHPICQHKGFVFVFFFCFLKLFMVKVWVCTVVMLLYYGKCFCVIFVNHWNVSYNSVSTFLNELHPSRHAAVLCNKNWSALWKPDHTIHPSIHRDCLRTMWWCARCFPRCLVLWCCFFFFFLFPHL